MAQHRTREGITPEQVREARRLLGWSQLELRLVAKMASNTVLKVERGQSVSGRTIKKLREVFEAAGIEFNGEAGVRLKKARPGSPSGGDVRS